jgi:catechol 2,3-dioxygenase-like lactoylglutathione lyase family enzyme
MRRSVNMANEAWSSSSWRMMQIGLVVRDMDASVAKFSAMGFGPFVPKLLPPDSKVVINNNSTDFDVNVLRSMIGNVELELCQPVKGESPHQEFLDSKGEGIQHILFEVQDIEAELARLTEVGATVILKIDFKGGGLAYVDLNTCGFVVELIQLPKDNPEQMEIVLSLDAPNPAYNPYA